MFARRPCYTTSEHLGDRLRTEPVVEKLQLIGTHLTWVRDAARTRQREQIFPQGRNVAGDTHRFQIGIQTAGQPPVLGRHAGRTVVGVAPLSLDTADGEHRLTSHVDHVAAHRERQQRVLRKPELPRADEDDLLRDPYRVEDPVNPAELPS